MMLSGESGGQPSPPPPPLQFPLQKSTKQCAKSGLKWSEMQEQET